MAGGFLWKMDWDVNPLKRGGQQAADAIENAVDVFEDLAKSADRATEKAGNSLGDEVKSGTRTAEKALDALEDAFRDAAREADRQSKKAGDDLGDNVRRGSREAEDATGEFKDEARQNFSEVASSFSGDMDSAVDLVQGTLGGLAGTLTGPVGLALGGLAASAGLFYNAWRENSEATQQRISDMYEDMTESGNKYLSEQYLKDAMNDIITGADGAATSLENVEDSAERAGVSTSTMLRAWAGDQDAINEVLEKTKAKQDEITTAYDGAPLAQEDRARKSRLQDIVNGLEGVMESTDNARAKTELWDQALSELPSGKRTDVQLFTNAAQDTLNSWTRSTSPYVTATVNVDRSQAQTAVDAALRGVRPTVQVALDAIAGFRRP